MLNAIAGGAVAVSPLAERLDSLCPFPPAESASRALAQALVRAFAGRAIGPDVSERLARQLYTAMNGGYLRRARLIELTNQIEKELVQARVSPTDAAAVREAGMRVAREPRNPRTDWW